MKRDKVTEKHNIVTSRADTGDKHMEWATIFQAIGHPTIVVKPNHTIIEANQATAKATKLPMRKIIGRKCYEIFHLKDKPPEACPCERLKDSKTLVTEEMEIEALGGVYLVSCTPVLDDQGNLDSIIHIATDITNRKQAEKDLRENVERLTGVFDSIMKTLASVIETRDPYTAGHQKRVTYLASRIAIEMHATDFQKQAIYFAGLLHDIGKMAVPAEILAKPTQLLSQELVIVRTHPQIGYDILKQVDWPWPVAEIVYQHHERLNGSGYTRGIRRKAIVFEARVLAVADVVEAMLSHRPYRPARTMRETMREIQKNKGSLYDPAIVDTCLRILKRGKGIFEEIPLKVISSGDKG